MIIEIPSNGWAASGTAAGVGVWFFFVWCWLAKGNQRFGEVAASFGLVVCAGFGGAWLGSASVGEAGLSSLGGVVASGVAIGLLVKPWRATGRWLMDVLVPGGIAGLSVARLGCLWEGCDFGRPTQRGLAVIHEAGSRAWDVHVTHYGLAPGSLGSDPVHPFAAYLAGWGLVAAGLGEWRRRRGDAPGQAAMVSALVFLAGGGAIEWLREPETVIQIVDGVSVYPFIYWIGAVGAGWLWWYFGQGTQLKE